MISAKMFPKMSIHSFKPKLGAGLHNTKAVVNVKMYFYHLGEINLLYMYMITDLCMRHTLLLVLWSLITRASV